MQNKSKLLRVALVGMMAATTMSGIVRAYAAETKTAVEETMKDDADAIAKVVPGTVKMMDKGADAVAAQTAAAANRDIIRTVDEAYKGLREVRAARLAIFNGEPAAATEIAKTAQADFKAAQMSMEDTMVADISPALKDDGYIPFDSSMSLSEDFQPTAENKATLQKANEHLSKGEHMKAVDALKLAGINVSVGAAFIPANASAKHAEDAVNFLADAKYYEANLALKAIEDSIVMQSFNITEVPVQGTAG